MYLASNSFMISKLLTLFLMFLTLNAHSQDNGIGIAISTFHKEIVENPELKNSEVKQKLSAEVEESLKKIRELNSEILFDEDTAREKFQNTIAYKNDENKFKKLLETGFNDVKKANLIYYLSEALPNHAKKIITKLEGLTDVQVEAILKLALLARSNIFGDMFDTFELSKTVELLLETTYLSQDSVDKSDKLLSELVEKTIHKNFKLLGKSGPIMFPPALLYGVTDTYANALLAFESTKAFPELEGQMRNTISKFGFITNGNPLMVKKYLEALHVSIKEKKKEIFLYMEALYQNDRLASPELPSDFMMMSNFKKYRIPEDKIDVLIEELEEIISEKLPPYKPHAIPENRKIQENYNKALNEKVIRLEMALSQYTNCFDRLLRSFF